VDWFDGALLWGDTNPAVVRLVVHAWLRYIRMGSKGFVIRRPTALRGCGNFTFRACNGLALGPSTSFWRTDEWEVLQRGALRRCCEELQ
jgi:hypothetical protein